MNTRPTRPIVLAERILWQRDDPHVEGRVMVDASRRIWWCEVAGGVESKWREAAVHKAPFAIHTRV